jgi:hypothetical protein
MFHNSGKYSMQENGIALESSVKAYGDKKKLHLEVYTGPYGVAKLPNINGVET